MMLTAVVVTACVRVLFLLFATVGDVLDAAVGYTVLMLLRLILML